MSYFILPRSARHLSSSLALTTLLFSAALYAAPSAQEASKEAATSAPQATPTSDVTPLGLRVALGLSSGANGSFIQKPKNEYYQLGAILYDNIVYPGFGGVGGLIGAQLDIGWRFVTLSTGYTLSFDQAEGKANGLTMTIKQQTAHIPLTLSLELPSKIASPLIFGGFDWVSPSEGELEMSDAIISSPYQGITAKPYRAWRFGLGVDVMLTDVLRLPIRLYGLLNPVEKDTLNDSIAGDPLQGKGSLRGEWDWQAGVTLGLSYDVYRR